MSPNELRAKAYALLNEANLIEHQQRQDNIVLLAESLMNLLQTAPSRLQGSFSDYFRSRFALGYSDLHFAMPHVHNRDIDAAIDTLIETGRVIRFKAKVHQRSGGRAHFIVPTEIAHLLKDSPYATF